VVSASETRSMLAKFWWLTALPKCLSASVECLQTIPASVSYATLMLATRKRWRPPSEKGFVFQCGKF
ncbi:uncharacterized protein METZ01_LOCUS461442, partial [marine metagenome]